jgi:hypothetical protein
LQRRIPEYQARQLIAMHERKLGQSPALPIEVQQCNRVSGDALRHRRLSGDMEN